MITTRSVEHMNKQELGCLTQTSGIVDLYNIGIGYAIKFTAMRSIWYVFCASSYIHEFYNLCKGTLVW